MHVRPLNLHFPGGFDLSAVIKPTPVPLPLATPTDLMPEGVARIAAALNPLAADAVAL
ncbi:hypothetical protein GCM10022631_14300 [Deinococcus rubellus]